MEVFRVRNIDESYRALVQNIIMKGSETMPRELLARELEDVILEYTPPFSYVFMNEKRRINPVFHLVELFYFLNGRSDSILIDYVHDMKDFCNDNGRFDGSYGPSIYESLPFVIRELSEKDSRRAVLPILRSHHLVQGSRDIPCNVFLAFRIRNKKLILEVFTRSQDVFKGFLYDTLEFQLLQTMLSHLLGTHVGKYIHHMVSVHLYEKDSDAALQSLTVPSRLSEFLPAFPTFDTPPDFWRYTELLDATMRLADVPVSKGFDDIQRAIVSWRYRKRVPREFSGLYCDWVNWWLDNRK